MKITISFYTSHWYKDWSDKIIDLLISFGVATEINITKTDN